MQHLAFDSVVGLAQALDVCNWSWAIDELGPILEAAGLEALDSLDSPSVRIQLPQLRGVDGFVVNMPDESLVLMISVSLTEVIAEDDHQAHAVLDILYQDYAAALTGAFGPPDERSKKTAMVWDRGEEVFELRDLEIALCLVRESKNSRRIREGG